MIEEISPVNLVHVTLTEEYATKIRPSVFYTQWRTTDNGDYWQCLMGMSWEEIDPPQEVIDEYKRLSGVI